jgi:hypothetical protein
MPASIIRCEMHAATSLGRKDAGVPDRPTAHRRSHPCHQPYEALVQLVLAQGTHIRRSGDVGDADPDLLVDLDEGVAGLDRESDQQLGGLFLTGEEAQEDGLGRIKARAKGVDLGNQLANRRHQTFDLSHEVG